MSFRGFLDNIGYCCNNMPSGAISQPHLVTCQSFNKSVHNSLGLSLALQTNMEGQGEVSRLGDNNYENTDVGGGRIRSRDEEHESRSGSDNNGKHGTCTRPNKQRIISLVLPQTELAKGTLNPDMIVNEDSENLAPCPINILEETVVPIKMTHMQSSAVPRMDPFNQNITEFVSASPGENLHEYKFYLPDKPQDPVS